MVGTQMGRRVCLVTQELEPLLSILLEKEVVGLGYSFSSSVKPRAQGHVFEVQVDRKLLWAQQLGSCHSGRHPQNPLFKPLLPIHL